MDALRTPDDRFADLPDYSFAPNYVEVPSGDEGTLRVHHVDEGPIGGHRDDSIEPVGRRGSSLADGPRDLRAICHR